MKLTEEQIRILALENALKIIATWANCDSGSPQTRAKAMADIHKCAMKALGITTNDKVAK